MKKTKRVQQKNKEGLRFGAAFFFVAERRSHPDRPETGGAGMIGGIGDSAVCGPPYGARQAFGMNRPAYKCARTQAHARVREIGGRPAQQRPGRIDCPRIFWYPLYNKSELIFFTARYKRKDKPGMFSTFSPTEKKRVDKQNKNSYTKYIRKQKGLFPRKFSRTLFQIFEN